MVAGRRRCYFWMMAKMVLFGCCRMETREEVREASVMSRKLISILDVWETDIAGVEKPYQDVDSPLSCAEISWIAFSWPVQRPLNPLSTEAKSAKGRLSMNNLKVAVSVRRLKIPRH